MKSEAHEPTNSGTDTHPASRPMALLDIGDVAQRLGTTERFVRRLVAERRVPFHKVGKYVRFDPRDIDRYLADQRVEAIV